MQNYTNSRRLDDEGTQFRVPLTVPQLTHHPNKEEICLPTGLNPQAPSEPACWGNNTSSEAKGKTGGFPALLETQCRIFGGEEFYYHHYYNCYHK